MDLCQRLSKADVKWAGFQPWVYGIDPHDGRGGSGARRKTWRVAEIALPLAFSGTIGEDAHSGNRLPASRQPLAEVCWLDRMLTFWCAHCPSLITPPSGGTAPLRECDLSHTSRWKRCRRATPTNLSSPVIPTSAVRCVNRTPLRRRISPRHETCMKRLCDGGPPRFSVGGGRLWRPGGADQAFDERCLLHPTTRTARASRADLRVTSTLGLRAEIVVARPFNQIGPARKRNLPAHFAVRSPQSNKAGNHRC